MTVLTSPVPECGLTTDDVGIIGATAVLNVHSHVDAANVSRGHADHALCVPNLEQPKLQLSATNEDWNAFNTDAVAGQLECTGEQLGNSPHSQPNLHSSFTRCYNGDPEKACIIPVPLGRVRFEFMNLFVFLLLLPGFQEKQKLASSRRCLMVHAATA